MPENNTKLHDKLCTLTSFIISVLIFSLLAGAFRLWDTTGSIISQAFYVSALFCIIPLTLCAFKIFKNSGIAGLKNFKISAVGFGYGLFVYIISDYCCRGFNLFQGPSIRAEIITVFIILLACSHLLTEKVLKYFFISSVAVLISLFLYLSEGQPIISDDHASFILRLSLLKQYFPNIPIYFPGWNAGLDARDFFATGAFGYFLLTAPLHYLLRIELSHNLALISVLFIILPTSLAYACRQIGLSKSCSYIAAILSLATSLIWYRWALKYGTVGFITSASLMPSVFVLGYKLINSEILSKRQMLLLIALGSVSVMWPLGAVCYLSLFAFALINFKNCLRNKQLLIAVLVLILINLPWAVTFWKVSGVAKFVNKNSVSSDSATVDNSFRHKSKGFDASNALKVLRETANSTNPLILFLAIPGIFLMPGKFRLVFSAQAILFLAGGTLLVSVKPQLELDRLLVFLIIFLCIPTALALKFLLNNCTQQRAVSSLSFSFLFLSPFIAANILHNRSAENYSFAGQVSEDIRQLTNQYPASGRYLFSGFVLHELDGGHVAPLPVWTDKAFIASSPFHNKWSYSSVFPDNFVSRGDQGINEFLDLYNVEIILAHEARWRNYFSERPQQYELLWHKKPFMVFRRKNFNSNYFIKGQGQVTEHNKDKIILQTNSQNAVIKFNYFPFLKSSNCKISGFDVATEFPFIELKDCDTSRPVVIDSVSPFTRVFND